jgi:hypothetical protein
VARIADTQQALETWLSLMPSLPETAWPNVEHTPIEGTTYLRPNILPASSSTHDLLDTQSNPGIFQIDIYTPANEGSIKSLTLADTIYDHFARQDLSTGSLCLYINQIEVNTAQRIDSWHVLSVSIYYNSYSN